MEMWSLNMIIDGSMIVGCMACRHESPKGMEALLGIRKLWGWGHLWICIVDDIAASKDILIVFISCINPRR